jgi:hypothetical protein
LLATPAFAADPVPTAFGAARGDNKIVFKAEVVESAIRDMVAMENQQGAATEYEKQIDKTTGEITIAGLYKVCTAAGFDVRQTHGFNDCRRFVSFMLSKTLKGGNIDQCFGEWNGVKTDGKCVGRDGQPVVYAKACLESNKNAGICVRDFNGLETQVPVGKEFIYQWGKLRGLAITCSNYAYRTDTPGGFNLRPQDFLQCTAGGKAYEFEFDSLNMDPGKASAVSENQAICEVLYKGKIISSGRDFESICDNVSDCRDLNVFASSIGRSVGGSLGNKCGLSTNVEKNNAMFLKTAFGIDNKVFYKSKIQSRADLVQKQLEEYLRTHPATRGQTSISCQPQIKKITDAAGQYENDYYMTCYAGGQQIDFIFDDLTEAWDSYAQGGVQGMSCIVSGGTYTGKKCIGLSEQQCIALGKANIADCPECKSAKWDTDPNNPSAKTCVLPSSAKATNIQKGIKIAGIAGMAVGGVIITVATAGTGAGAIAIVLVEATGAGMEIGSEIRMSQIAQEWLSLSEQCRSASCAETMLRDDLQRMSNLSSSFTDVEIVAIDSELARLIGMLPTNSPVYKRTLAENSLGFFNGNSWEPIQVVRAIGIGMQLASLATSVGKWAVKLNRTHAAFQKGLTESAAHADDAVKGSTKTSFSDLNPFARNSKPTGEFSDVVQKYRKSYDENIATYENNYYKFYADLNDGKISKSEFDNFMKMNEDTYLKNLDDLRHQAVRESSGFFDKEAAKLNSDAERNFLLKTIGEDQTIIDSKGRTLQDMAFDFRNLKEEDKIKFGQALVDKLGDYAECPGGVCDFKLPQKADWQGLYDYKDIHVKDTKSLDSFMNTLIHENGHRVDHIMPSSGSLGAEKANFGYEIYTGLGPTYRKNLTEQSSFYKGNKESNFFEWELAKKYGSVEQQVKSGINTIIDMPVTHPYTTVAVGGAAAIGTSVVVTNAVMDNKYEKEKPADEQIQESQSITRTK